jgi:hypothetical protein
MRIFLEKLKKSDFIFSLLVFVFSILPIILKLLVTGIIGTVFKFYFFVLWLPIVVLTFSVLRNLKESIFTSLLLVGAFIASLISYPNVPPMDFHRQIVYQLEFWLIFAVLASLALRIALPRLRKSVGR